MSHTEDHFREILGSRLAGAEADAPGITWADFSRSRKKRTFVFWWWRVAVVAILFLGTVFYIKLPRSVNDRTQIGRKSNTASEIPSKDAEGNAVSKVPQKAGNSRKQAFSRPEVPSYSEIREITGYMETETPETPVNIEYHDAEMDFYGLGISIVKLNYTQRKSALIPEPVLYGFRDLKWKFKDGLYWKLQAGASLNMPQFRVTDAGRAFIHKDYEGIRRNSEQGMTGYGVQAALAKVSGRWVFSAGLGYSLSEIRGQYDFMYSEKPVIDIDGRIVNYAMSAPVNIRFGSRQKITFAEIPVSVQYRFSEKNKFILAAQLAYIPQFLSSISGELPNSVLLDHRETMRNVNYKGMASVFEIGLPLYKGIDLKSKLSVMPFYRLHLGLDQVQSLYKTKLNNWGLNCSYLIAF